MNAQRKLRVAYLCHEYPKYTETFVYREVDSLRKLGVDVLVFAMKRPERIHAIEDAEGKIRTAHYLRPDFSFLFFWAQIVAVFRNPIRYVKLLIGIIGVEKRRSGTSLRLRLGYFLRGALAALEIGREGGTDIIHCPATGDDLIAARVASKFSGIPFSFTLHSPLALYLGSPRLAGEARDASLIVAISEDARSRIIALAGDEIAGRVKVIHCGVDLPSPRASRALDSRRIISVASLWGYKGHDVLIRAMGLLAARGIEVACEIIGEGGEQASLETLIEKEGIKDRVKLLGGKPPEVIWKMLEGAQCFVLASRVDKNGTRDGIPVALMEAMARSVPCISTRISGIPELINDGETGLLVEPDDPAALASAIQKMLEDSNLAHRLGESGREWVASRFSLDKGARLIANEFAKLADSPDLVGHWHV